MTVGWWEGTQEDSQEEVSLECRSMWLVGNCLGYWNREAGMRNLQNSREIARNPCEGLTEIKTSEQ